MLALDELSLAAHVGDASSNLACQFGNFLPIQTVSIQSAKKRHDSCYIVYVLIVVFDCD